MSLSVFYQQLTGKTEQDVKDEKRVRELRDIKIFRELVSKAAKEGGSRIKIKKQDFPTHMKQRIEEAGFRITSSIWESEGCEYKDMCDCYRCQYPEKIGGFIIEWTKKSELDH